MQQIAISNRSARKFTRADLALVVMAALLALSALTGHVTISPAGAALAGLSLVVSVVVVAFARRQLRADPRRDVFTRLSAGLGVATLIVAFASDALLIVAGWIACGRMMVGLIGHVGGWDEARTATRRATLAFTVSDLALIGAAITLALAAGSTNIATISSSIPAMTTAKVLAAALLLVLAAIARCAAPPFSGWLIGSLAAPTPVSALMHAGFVNAGGFLLVRFATVLEAVPMAGYTLFAVGLIAALVGSAIMSVRSDVKGALAASTVAQMGFMLLTIALGAYATALWHMVAHGVFKAWLFLGSSGTVSTPSGGPKGLSWPMPALIAVTVMVGMGLAISTSIASAVLPLGLALAALLGALTVALRNACRSLHSLALLTVPMLLIGLNVAALAAMSTVQPPAATPLLSPLAQFALLAVFLGLWVGQQRAGAGGSRLHPAIFARLLHMGTSAPRPVQSRHSKD
jgi:NAD(P)H-quinone oxidoreductase subunit 5